MSSFSPREAECLLQLVNERIEAAQDVENAYIGDRTLPDAETLLMVVSDHNQELRTLHSIERKLQNDIAG